MPIIFLTPVVTYVFEIAVVLFGVGRRHQHLHVLAEDFQGHIAEQPLGSGIEGIDRSFLVDRDDRIDGRIENGPRSRFALAQGFIDRELDDLIAHAIS